MAVRSFRSSGAGARKKASKVTIGRMSARTAGQGNREWTVSGGNLNNRSAMLPHPKALLMDLDGVVCRGITPLPGAHEAIPTLQRLGIRYAFVTNNATMTPAQTANKLRDMGVDAAADDIVTSPLAAAAYLRSLTSEAAKVCVVG